RVFVALGHIEGRHGEMLVPAGRVVVAARRWEVVAEGWFVAERAGGGRSSPPHFALGGRNGVSHDSIPSVGETPPVNAPRCTRQVNGHANTGSPARTTRVRGVALAEPR